MRLKGQADGMWRDLEERDKKGGAAYLAGGFAVNALRVGNPPFLWGILMILSLSLLWVYRR